MDKFFILSAFILLHLRKKLHLFCGDLNFSCFLFNVVLGDKLLSHLWVHLRLAIRMISMS